MLLPRKPIYAVSVIRCALDKWLYAPILPGWLHRMPFAIYLVKLKPLHTLLESNMINHNCSSAGMYSYTTPK